MDLANDIIRETYRPKTKLAAFTSRSMEHLRKTLMAARRYELDESMSAFLAHLSSVPFSAAPERMMETLASLRCSAKLPFSPMFFEFDYRKFRETLIEYEANKVDFYGKPLINTNLKEVPSRMGFLLEHGSGEEDVIVTEFTEEEELGIGVATLPWQWTYRTDNLQFPESKFDVKSAYFACGVGGLDRSIAVYHDQWPLPKKEQMYVSVDGETFQTHRMLPEFGGVVRYVICFLATLNDAPTIKEEVRPSKGYLARGKMRKYLEHTVLTLQLPRKLTLRTLAKRLIANARRKWHEVEPHWRINQKPKGWLCEPAWKHLWSERDESGHSYCSECGSRRVWIVLPHGRGDASLGIVHHLDRKVTHA